MKRIYLDKCFWIRLRDEILGRQRRPGVSALLERLRARVRQGNAICPITDILFLELMKQSDLSTRRATAELMDELSGGVTLIPHEERFKLEIATFILSRLGLQPKPIDQQVWSKVAFVFGIQHPLPHPTLNADAIQIRFFEHQWDFTLVQMLDVIGNRPAPDTFFAEQAVALNEGNAEHAKDLRSYAKTYQDELVGVLELAVPTVIATIAGLQGVSPSAMGGVENVDRQLAHASLVQAMQTQAGKLALRTTHLQATLHAATRWNRAKRLLPNDLPDFLHAQSAVAYYHAFFTDGPTKHLLDQKNLLLHNDFGCYIASTEEQALEWLDSDC